MEYYSSHINKLIEQLSHLPGIGAKSAQRLAFHIMNMPKDQVEQLTSSITGARENVQYCKCCCTLTDREICPICSNDKRDHSVIMVVENTRDLAAYEKTGKFDGVYHVLHGAISPMLGIGPDDIKLKELMQRLAKLKISSSLSLQGNSELEPPPPPDCVMLVAPLMPSMNILTAVPSTSLKRISHISSMMVFSAIFLASGILVQILLLIVSSS